MRTMTAVDRIRYKQLYIQMLSELLEEFKDYINDIAVKNFGRPSRFIVLTKINTINKIGSKGLQLVSAEFNTEQGILELSIAIKEFTTSEEAMKNSKLTDLIAQRLHTFDGKVPISISTPKVVEIYDSTLIYEGIQGHTFTESNINYEKKLHLAGLSLAVYHSPVQKSADLGRYSHILKSVLEQLPVPADRKKKYLAKAVGLLENTGLDNSGTAVFGDFHQENIMFSEETDRAGKETIKSWLIDPEYAEEEEKADRMEDIATFFLHPALSNYKENNNLKKLRKDVQCFYKGYNAFLKQFNLSIIKLYDSKHEESFAFHMGLSALLEALFTVKRGHINDEETMETLLNCLGLANHCWTKGLS